MLVIFISSSQDSEASGKLSGRITEILSGLFPNMSSIDAPFEEKDFIIRKLAHFSSYFVLQLLVYGTVLNLDKFKSKTNILISFSITVLYACSDEFHQLFTGRGSSYKDVLLDSAGALLAVFLISAVILYKRKAEKSSRKIEHN